MKNFLHRFKYIILGWTIGLAGIAGAINITVPSAQTAGYFLVSTSTGAYIATSSSPLYIGSLYASSTATSTFAGSINLTSGGSHVTAHGFRSDASDGIHFHANNWTEVANFGAGNTANATFYGGVNVTGAFSVLGTSLATFPYSSSTVYSSFITSSTTNAFFGTGQGFAYVGSLGKLNVVASTSVGFLLDTGDVGTGVFDFGGATSFEIPNGTSPTTNAIGILALDTTSNNLILATTTTGHIVVASATTTLYSFTASTTAITSGTIIDMPSKGLPQVLVAMWCKVSGGTSIQIFISDGTNDTNTITCTTTGTQFALTSNNTFTANEAIRMEFGTKTGDTGYLTVDIRGYRTSD